MVAVVLVDNTHKIDPKLLTEAANALDYQVNHDLAPTWSGISANVTTAPSLAALPSHAWPVFLVKSLPPDEGGYHLDQHNQPYAKVIASPHDPSWTIDASHEIIEMLVDPFGNRLEPSQAIAIQGNGVVDAPGVYKYLVEACDPCEANEFAYDINGIAVSDFITPNFYDSSITTGARYSFKGNIQRPRELLEGGYITYVASNNDWRQILWVDPGPPQYKDLGQMEAVRSLRLEVHKVMGAELDNRKHAQRRKAGGLRAAVQSRVDTYHELRSDQGRNARLQVWYGVSEDES